MTQNFFLKKNLLVINFLFSCKMYFLYAKINVVFVCTRMCSAHFSFKTQINPSFVKRSSDLEKSNNFIFSFFLPLNVYKTN